MVTADVLIPQRGQVVWITLNPQAGPEQAGRRPALVLSPEIYNRRTGLAVFCPITSQIMGYPFEVRIPAGLPIDGVILADQIKSLDWRVRKVELICLLPSKVIKEVLEKVNTLLA